MDVYTGRQAIPIENADVAICREDPEDPKGRMKLVWFTTTDASGKTDSFLVPTVNGTLSETPGNPHPFSTYCIKVCADGYETVARQPVDVFGGETSQALLEMIPTPEQITVPQPAQEVK